MALEPDEAKGILVCSKWLVWSEDAGRDNAIETLLILCGHLMCTRPKNMPNLDHNFHLDFLYHILLIPLTKNIERAWRLKQMTLIIKIKCYFIPLLTVLCQGDIWEPQKIMLVAMKSQLCPFIMHAEERARLLFLFLDFLKCFLKWIPISQRLALVEIGYNAILYTA